MKISLIAAVTKNGIIGKDNDMPWSLPADLKYFKEKTQNKIVIMGRRTWESIGERPLPNRMNVIITSIPEKVNTKFQNVGSVLTLMDALAEVARAEKESGKEQEVFIIGGGQLYKEAIKIADKLYITEIQAEIDGDIKFPKIDKNIFKETDSLSYKKDDKNDYDMIFKEYHRVK